jgi:hypothetical protein
MRRDDRSSYPAAAPARTLVVTAIVPAIVRNFWAGDVGRWISGRCSAGTLSR